MMVPENLLLVLGYSRMDLVSMGMVGCSMQLGSDYEVSWSASSVLLDNGDATKIFFVHRSWSVTTTSFARVTIPDAQAYFKAYPGIKRFLDNYRTNRFRRLGRRAFLDPWELDSRDAFIINMKEKDFDSFFVSDPRSGPTVAQVITRVPLHSPMLIGVEPPGIPLPEVHNWI